MVSDDMMLHFLNGFDICFWAAALHCFVHGVRFVMNHSMPSAAPVLPPDSGPINAPANTGIGHQSTPPNAAAPTMDGSNRNPPSPTRMVSGARKAYTTLVRTPRHSVVTPTLPNPNLVVAPTQLQTMPMRTHPNRVVAPTSVNAGPSNSHQTPATQDLSPRENRKRKREEQEVKDKRVEKALKTLGEPWF
jgi:hypothetical protein